MSGGRLVTPVVLAAAAQVGPAATWLPRVRRVMPRLAGIGRPGHLALTFDDGPDAQGTPAVLEALDRLGWRATFFVLGEQARRNPSLLRETLAAGHELGTHGDRHHYLIARTPGAVSADLRRAWATTAEITGVAPRWFRPAYGVLSGPAWHAARRLRMTTVLWSAWGRDWRADATPAEVVADLCAGRLDGGTALLHDSDVTSAPGSWRRTVAALDLLAEHVADAGLAAGTLAEHGIAGQRADR